MRPASRDLHSLQSDPSVNIPASITPLTRTYHTLLLLLLIPNQLMMTCQICHDLSLHQIIVVTSLHDAVASQTSSCDTCLLLATIIKQFDIGDDKIVLATRPMWTKRGPGQQLQIQGIPPPIKSIYEKRAPEVNSTTFIDVFCAPGTETPHLAIQPGRMVASHSSSDQSFTQAAAWIKECEESHKSSCSLNYTSPLPTRVIDVMGHHGDGTPFLLESRGQHGRYASLSYCWGSTDQEKLTSTKVEAFKNALPMPTISKTISDAIMICKILQIQYLWVDALCILQDDYEDWILESSQMRQVYSESFLTLAASSTVDCSQGIFSTQSRASRLVKVKLRGKSVYARTSLPSREQHIGPFFIKDPLEPQIRHEEYRLLPLCRRGWALQERVMSNRVLYYTDEELWWECNEGVQCECDGPTNISAGISYLWLRNPWLKSTVITRENAYFKWKELVTFFSAGALTKPEDKLPAISGLAKQFEVMLWHRFKEKDYYCAGLWRSQLMRDLTWHTLPGSEESNIKNPCRPAQWRAPTWSWASVDGTIQFPGEENGRLRHFLTVVNVSVETSTQDLQGALSGGQLVLEGHSLYFPLRINRNLDKPGYTLALPPGISIPYQLLDTTFWPDYYGDDLVDGTECLCLLAGGYPWYKAFVDAYNSASEVEGSSYAQFLVLRRINGMKKGQYERVGFASCQLGVGLNEMETCELFENRKVTVV
jgi:hypothetical protein